jgi:hypothetical protein
MRLLAEGFVEVEELIGNEGERGKIFESDPVIRFGSADSEETGGRLRILRELILEALECPENDLGFCRVERALECFACDPCDGIS